MKITLTKEQIEKQIRLAIEDGNRCKITELHKLLRQLKKQQQ
jgi:hypothetical protein